MSKEKDVLIDYEVDGIQEYDNPIPLWLNLIFVGTIVFSLIYLPYYHVFGLGKLQLDEYREEMAAAAALRKQQEAKASRVDLMALVADPQVLAEGKEIFTQNCAACHGPNGEGVIGPNLTDAEWIHGGSVTDITRTIAEGVPDKGMPAWKPTLGIEKVQKVAAYVYSLGHPRR